MIPWIMYWAHYCIFMTGAIGPNTKAYAILFYLILKGLLKKILCGLVMWIPILLMPFAWLIGGGVVGLVLGFIGPMMDGKEGICMMACGPWSIPIETIKTYWEWNMVLLPEIVRFMFLVSKYLKNGTIGNIVLQCMHIRLRYICIAFHFPFFPFLLECSLLE
jgi:hypothetical protein